MFLRQLTNEWGEDAAFDYFTKLADNILRLCRKPVVRRSLIGARKVMEILQISRPTLRAYVKSGALTQINYSPRKVRFDEEEVRNFSYSGAVK